MAHDQSRLPFFDQPLLAKADVVALHGSNPNPRLVVDRPLGRSHQGMDLRCLRNRYFS